MHLSDLKKISYKQWQWQDVLFVLFVNLCRVFSLFIFLVCFGKIVGILLKYLNFNNTLSQNNQVHLFFILIYGGYILAYAVVHIESRYLAAIISLPTFIGLYGLQHIFINIKKYLGKTDLHKTVTVAVT